MPPAFARRRADAAARGRLLGLGLRPASRTPALGRSRALRSASRQPARWWSRRGAAKPGPGHATTLAQIAADAARGRSVSGDRRGRRQPHLSARDFHDRRAVLAVTAGSSVEIAARKVRDKAIKVAAHMLEAGEHDLEDRKRAGSRGRRARHERAVIDHRAGSVRLRRRAGPCRRRAGPGRDRLFRKRTSSPSPTGLRPAKSKSIPRPVIPGSPATWSRMIAGD